ncbi:diguanylate cyclase [Sphingobacterium sp.]|uniref:diguanylate cyclase n=1 Tax=Sphingobacterium sp. TaxID=341027 RepID=UPI00289D7E8E|nr:diguanylate cyclase [Sphingobacterium sp.]
MGIAKIWNKITNHHLPADLDGLDLIKARVLNQYSFLIAFFFFIDSIRDFLAGYRLTSFFLFVVGITFLLLFFYTKVRFNDFFVFAVMLLCCILVLFFSSLIGFESGISFYYFAILLAIVFLFNERKNYAYGLILFGVILSFFYLGQEYENPIFSNSFETAPELVKTIRIHTFVQILIFTAFNAYLLISKNREISNLFAQKERSELIIDQLNEKITDTDNSEPLEKLVNLAMNDSASFLPVFKEIFPDFYGNLAAINPNMTIEEFKFCALLRLGFTTKDIATFTHLAVRSVQTKKNRLRKSFNIPSEEDLYTWVESI